MDLNLNKIPWYAQVGMFVVIALGAWWACSTSSTSCRSKPRWRRASLSSRRCAPTLPRAQSTANQLNQFKQQVSELETRLESLKAVLPEQKDVGDLLRRIQTLATQSNLAIRGFKPSPSVTKQLHEEWPIQLQLDGTYHNLGDVLRSRQQVLANHQRQQHHDPREREARGDIDHYRRLHGDDVRAARYIEAGPGKGELT